MADEVKDNADGDTLLQAARDKAKRAATPANLETLHHDGVYLHRLVAPVKATEAARPFGPRTLDTACRREDTLLNFDDVDVNAKVEDGVEVIDLGADSVHMRSHVSLWQFKRRNLDSPSRLRKLFLTHCETMHRLSITLGVRCKVLHVRVPDDGSAFNVPGFRLEPDNSGALRGHVHWGAYPENGMLLKTVNDFALGVPDAGAHRSHAPAWAWEPCSASLAFMRAVAEPKDDFTDEEGDFDNVARAYTSANGRMVCRALEAVVMNWAMSQPGRAKKAKWLHGQPRASHDDACEAIMYVSMFKGWPDGPLLAQWKTPDNYRVSTLVALGLKTLYAGQRATQAACYTPSIDTLMFRDGMALTVNRLGHDVPLNIPSLGDLTDSDSDSDTDTDASAQRCV